MRKLAAPFDVSVGPRGQLAIGPGWGVYDSRRSASAYKRWKSACGQSNTPQGSNRVLNWAGGGAIEGPRNFQAQCPKTFFRTPSDLLTSLSFLFQQLAISIQSA